MAQPIKTAFDYGATELTLEIKIPGIAVRLETPKLAIESIEYSYSLEDEIKYGASRQPQMRSDGQFSYEGSLNLYRFYFQYLIRQCRESGVALGKAEFLIGVTFFDKTGQDVFVDTLTRVKIKGAEHSLAEGAELAMVNCPIQPMNIYYDGFDLEGEPLGSGSPIGGGSSGLAGGAPPGIGGQLIFP